MIIVLDRKLNKFNSKFVAVTVNPSDEFIKNVVLGNFDFIQLHGSESRERIKKFFTSKKIK